MAPVARTRDEVEPPLAPSRRLGVIDVGSNTARMVVYEAPEGGMPRAILERKEVPRLGEGVGVGGRLSSAAVERGLASLHRFAQTLESLGNPPTVAVATSAVRDASDGGEFVRRAVEATGLPLRILTGEEEARYAYLGVASAWELSNDVVCDLGGGSLQLVSVRKGQFGAAVSLPLGALRLTEEFFEHDPPKEREVEELRQHVREFLMDHLPADAESGEYELHGVGGTIRTLARVSIELREYPVTRVHGYSVTRRDLEALAELLTDLPADKRRDVKGIGGDRADVIVAGLHTVLELVRATGRTAVRVSGMGIREGLAQESLGLTLPATSDELLTRSVTTASRVFGFSLRRSELLASRAVQMFDLLSSTEGWGKPERRALRTAALFHDAGAAIDLWGHPHHSSYLVRNFPVVGLDHRELVLASLIAYQHEGDDLPAITQKELRLIVTKDDVRVARRLGVLVYAAETLDDAEVRIARAAEGPLLVTLSPEGARGLSPRTYGRLRKPLKRAFDLEVEIRGVPAE
ncbi:MAG TPA: Ppx/GppA phosphatase family protein [Thermoplasmata archaeon]|nr:Ppx/GppA phosphatase family protein [Thermoplasmata archaeon]